MVCGVFFAAMSCGALVAMLTLLGAFRLQAALPLVGRFCGHTVFQTLRGVFGVEVVVAVDGHFFFDDFFDVLEVVSLVARTEGDGLSGLSGAGGSADAVDVAFGLIGQVEVDHMRDALDVDAAGGDIGRDQHAEVPLAESIERAGAGILAFVAMDRVGRDFLMAKIFADSVRAAFGSREDQRAGNIAFFQEGFEEAAFIVFIDEQQGLLDPLSGRRLRGHFDSHRIGQHSVGEFGDGIGHGRGEKEALSLGGQGVDHASHVVDEAHIEHPVRLIEDEVIQVFQRDESLAHQVEQASWCGDEDVGFFPQGAFLGGLIHAAEDHRAGEAQVAAIGFEAVVDLGGEFAGGRHHQHANVLLAGVAGVEALQDGQGESGGFTGSGLRAPKKVASFQQRRDRLGLDGRGDFVALVRYGAGEGFNEIQFSKGFYFGHSNGFPGRGGVLTVSRKRGANGGGDGTK